MRAGPALQDGSELPAEIGSVLETGIDAITAIGRVAVRRVAGDEDAARAICVRQCEAQVPEADMLEFNFELGADRLVEKRPEVEIVSRRPKRNRRMEEPGGAQVDTAKEAPVALQLRIEHVVERLAGISLEQLVQFLRAEDQQHHQPVMVGAGLRYPGSFTHQRAATVAADDVGGPKEGAAFSRR